MALLGREGAENRPEGRVERTERVGLGTTQPQSEKAFKDEVGATPDPAVEEAIDFSLSGARDYTSLYFRPKQG